MSSDNFSFEVFWWSPYMASTLISLCPKHPACLGPNHPTTRPPLDHNYPTIMSRTTPPPFDPSHPTPPSWVLTTHHPWAPITSLPQPPTTWALTTQPPLTHLITHPMVPTISPYHPFAPTTPTTPPLHLTLTTPPSLGPSQPTPLCPNHLTSSPQLPLGATPASLGPNHPCIPATPPLDVPLQLLPIPTTLLVLGC